MLCPKCKKTFVLSEEEEDEYDQTPDYKPVRREMEQAEADEDEISEVAPKKSTPKKQTVGK